MNKQILPIIIIVASVILIFANIIMSEDYDRGFWMRIVSSLLLIGGMIFTLIAMRNFKK